MHTMAHVIMGPSGVNVLIQCESKNWCQGVLIRGVLLTVELIPTCAAEDIKEIDSKAGVIRRVPFGLFQVRYTKQLVIGGRGLSLRRPNETGAWRENINSFRSKPIVENAMYPSWPLRMEAARSVDIKKKL